MGTEFLSIKDPEDAKKIIDKLPFERKTEKVSINDAYQRVLAVDVYSEINLPSFNRASMDGYAVIAEDTFGASEENPVKLDLIEIVKAGSIPTKKLERGTCIEVATGAPMPEGATGLVMIEFTERKGDDIYIYETAPMGQYIAKEGSDIKEGEIILSKGKFLSADKIGVLSAVGIKNVEVYSKPKVAVISTGNELIESQEKMEYGKIYDINSETISNSVKSCGCIPIKAGITKDDYDDLSTKINDNLNADLIITSGGTSAGTGDVLRQVLDGLGEVFIHGIAVKPGKPAIVGNINDKYIFGLPGYPVSAFIVFNVFFAPFLRKMAAMPYEHTEDNEIQLEISRRYHSSRGREQYVLVKIEGNKAHPIMKDSGAIKALADADGYFKISKNVEIINEGSLIKVKTINKEYSF
ncbi:MAG: gephyrin-like molybdotransferase Glp [Methanomicrobiales archaeon]